MRSHLAMQSICVGSVLLLGSTAALGISAPLSLSEITARADWIGVVRIVEVSPVGSPVSFFDVRTSSREVIKGTQLGCADGVRIREGAGISTAVEYRADEVRLVFLRQLEGCLFTTEASIQGALRITDDLVLLADESWRSLLSVVEEIRVAMR